VPTWRSVTLLRVKESITFRAKHLEWIFGES